MVVRRTLILAVIIAIGLPILLFIGSQNQAVQEQQTALSNIQAYRVTVGNVDTSVEASGEVEADRVVGLSFLSGGRVQNLYVQEGDYVMADSILGNVEYEMQTMAYQQAYLNINRAELAKYDLVTLDENELELASQSLQSAWTQLGNADNAVTDADLQAMNIQYQELLEQAQVMQVNADQAPGGYFGDNYDNLQAQAGEASFNAELARLQMESAMEREQPGINAAYANVINQQANLEVLLAGPNDYALRRADLQLEQAHLDMSHAQKDYADAFLIAPFNGVVSNLTIEQGSLVNPGGQVMRLTDVDNLIVTIFVDEIDIGRVTEGMPVQITADALPGMVFEGTLYRIAPSSSINDGVVVYEVEVVVEDADAVLRVGMTVDAEILLDRIENTIVVPSAYVRREPGGVAFVTVLNDDGTREQRQVMLGLRGQQTTEILQGVVPGELVIIENLNLEVSGSPFGG